VKGTHPFAHYFGLAPIARHARNTGHKVAASHAAMAVRRAAANAGVKFRAAFKRPTPTFAKLLAEPTPATAASLDWSQKDELAVITAERGRGREIMAYGLSKHREHLALSLFKSKLSAEAATAIIDAAEIDVALSRANQLYASYGQRQTPLSL
jgi:hypothetical protein